jgi:hypothetical protein
LKTDFGGLPIAFHLTGGEASDRNFETLLDIGPDINPRAALGDKGYDSKSNRDAAPEYVRQFRIDKTCPPSFRSSLQGPARIEQAVGKLKRIQAHRNYAARRRSRYGSFAALACAFILIKSVHTA